MRGKEGWGEVREYTSHLITSREREREEVRYVGNVKMIDIH